MKQLLSVLLFSFLLMPLAFANTYVGDTKIHNKSDKYASFVGITSLNNSSYQNIIVVGPFSFNNLEVKNDAEMIGKTEQSQNGKFKNLVITGSFSADNVKCEQLKAVGLIEISHLEVKENTEVSGFLAVRQGHLENIVVRGLEMDLKDVEVNNIIFKEDVIEPEAQQVLKLSGDTVVHGDITFKNGKGIIQMSSNAKIEGHTYGASIQKLKHESVSKGEI